MDDTDLSKVVKKVNDTYALVAQLAMAHEMLRSWSNDSFDECIKKIANGNAETITKIDGLLEKISKAFQEIASVRREIANLKALFTADIKELKDCAMGAINAQHDLKTAHENIDKRIYALHNTTNVTLNANLKQMKSDLENRISNIPIPQDTVNMPQVVAQIDHQIEPTRRETNTATANINAHATKFIILEKKMEMALAQLKILEQK